MTETSKGAVVVTGASTGIGEASVAALTDQRPPARIRVVRRYLLDWTLPRLLPARWLDWLIARRLGFLAQATKRSRGAIEK